MENKTRKPHSFENLMVDNSKLNTGPNSSAHGAGMTVRSETLVPHLEDVRISGMDLTVTDNGDSSGGYSASIMLRLPSTRCQILGTFLDVTVNSIGAGILDGIFPFSVGTAPATDSTPTGTQVDVVPSTNVVVSSGTGSSEGANSVVMIQLDATTAKDIYLNVGVPDASITATGTINVDIVFRMIYLDLSDGE